MNSSSGRESVGCSLGQLDGLALDPASGALGQDLSARLPQFSQDRLTHQLLGEAIAGRMATTAGEVPQDAAAHRLLQRLDACLDTDIRHLPKLVCGRLTAQQALAITTYCVAGDSFARRARTCARTEAGNSSRRDCSWAKVVADPCSAPAARCHLPPAAAPATCARTRA